MLRQVCVGDLRLAGSLFGQKRPCSSRPLILNGIHHRLMPSNRVGVSKAITGLDLRASEMRPMSTNYAMNNQPSLLNVLHYLINSVNALSYVLKPSLGLARTSSSRRISGLWPCTAANSAPRSEPCGFQTWPIP